MALAAFPAFHTFLLSPMDEFHSVTKIDFVHEMSKREIY